MPRTAYGQVHSQQQHAHHSQVPGQNFTYSRSSQANSHLGMDGQQYSSHPTPASQAYGNNDLASQMLLQRLQQQSYNQPSQRGAGLDRFFNPTAYNSSQHAHVPPVPVSILVSIVMSAEHKRLHVLACASPKFPVLGLHDTHVR